MKSSPPLNLGVAERAVSADETDLRLDRWFKRHYPGLAHGKLEKLLRTGQIRVDGKRASANLRLASGQTIRIPPLPGSAAEKPAGPRPYRQRPDDAGRLRDMIIYEDDDVFVLNKPPGLAVQGGSGIGRHLDGMLAALAGKDGEKPKLVHRLDKETSGLLLLARTPLAASHFTAAFRAHKVAKTYCAVTIGVPKPASGTIDYPLGKSAYGRMHPDGEDAKPAHTRYRTLDQAGQAGTKGAAALVALLPTTGRTHQLRAHLALIGTPILGDPLYGPQRNEQPPMLETLKLGEGLHLHAWRLSVAHPRKGRLDLEAPLPDHMRTTFAAFGFPETCPKNLL